MTDKEKAIRKKVALIEKLLEKVKRELEELDKKSN